MRKLVFSIVTLLLFAFVAWFALARYSIEIPIISGAPGHDCSPLEKEIKSNDDPTIQKGIVAREPNVKVTTQSALSTAYNGCIVELIAEDSRVQNRVLFDQNKKLIATCVRPLSQPDTAQICVDAGLHPMTWDRYLSIRPRSF
jgi:hypothetical protein